MQTLGNYTRLTIQTDGASRSNPGPAAAGICILDGATSQMVAELGFELGIVTNNVAEYQAILHAVKWLLAHKGLLAHTIHLDFRLDSLLVVSQLSGTYQVKKPELGQLAEEVRTHLTQLPGTHTLTHIPRSENMCADRIANEILDKKRVPDSL